MASLTIPQFDDVAADVLPTAPVGPLGIGDSLAQGFRSGLTQTGAQLTGLGGRVAETYGFKDTGEALYKSAAAQQAEAAQQMDGVTKFAGVDGLRSGASWLAGTVGQSAPMIGAGLVGGLAGRGRFGGLAAATAATVPFMAGENVLSQQADPEQAARSVGVRNAIGGATAVGQAALGNVVPQLVGGKLIGRAAENAAWQSTGQIAAKNVGEAVVGNAAAGVASGELGRAAAGYLNPNRDTSGDEAARWEEGITGGAVGLPFAGMGFAGEKFANRGKVRPGGIDLDAMKAGEVGKTATDAPVVPPVDPNAPVDLSARPGDPATPDAPTSKIQQAADFGRDALNTVRDFVAKKKAEPTDLDAAQKVAEGGDLTDDDALNAAPPGSPQAAEVFKKGAADTYAQATKWAKELYESALTPEQRTTLESATQDLGSRASQATIAGLKVAQDTYDTGVQAAKALGDTVREHIKNRETAEPVVLKSGSTEGGKLAVANALHEVTGGDSRLAAERAGPTADLIDAMQGGARMTDAMYSKVLDTFGPDAEHVLASVHDKVFPRSTKRTEAFYQALSGLSEYVNNQTSLDDMITHSVLPEHADDMTPTVLKKTRGLLEQYVREQHVAGHGPEGKKFQDARYKEAFMSLFGPKTDDVIARYAKEAKNSEKLVNDRQFGDRGEPLDVTQAGVDARTRAAEERGQLTEGQDLKSQFEESRFYGGGRDKKNPAFMLTEDAHVKAGFKADDVPSVKALEKARFENPDRSVDYVSARDYAVDHGLTDEQLNARTKGRPDDYVMVEARGTKLEGRLTSADLDGMKLDTERFGNSKSRIDTPVNGVTLDAKRLLQVMRDKNPTRNASDEQGWMQRTARLFFEGVGGASDAIGARIGLNDNGLVVARKGGKDVTLGDLKKVKFAPEEVGDGQADGPTLKTQLLTDKNGKPVLDTDGAPVMSSTTSRAVLENRLGAHQLKMDALVEKSRALSAKEREGTLTGRDRYELKRNRDKYREMQQYEGYFQKALDGHVEAERKAVNQEQAAHEIGPDEQIHTAADVLKEADLQVKQPASKMGDKPSLRDNLGTEKNPVWAISKLGHEAIETRIKAFEASPSVAARNIGSKMRQLMKVFDEMNELQQNALLGVAEARTAQGRPDNVRASELVNALAKDFDIKGPVYGKDQAPVTPLKPRAPVKPTIVDVVNKKPADVIARVAKSTDHVSMRDTLDKLLRAKRSDNVDKVVDAINNRLIKLGQDDPQVRYDMLKAPRPEDFVGPTRDKAALSAARFMEPEARQPGEKPANLRNEEKEASYERAKSLLAERTAGSSEVLGKARATDADVKQVVDHMSPEGKQRLTDLVKKMVGDVVEVVHNDTADFGMMGTFQLQKYGKPVITLFHAVMRPGEQEKVAHHEAAHAVITMLDEALGRDKTRDIVALAQDKNVRDQLVAYENKLEDGNPGYYTRNPEEQFVQAYGLWATGHLKLEQRSPLQRVFDIIKALVTRVQREPDLQSIFTEIKEGNFADLGNKTAYDPRVMNTRSVDRGFFNDFADRNEQLAKDIARAEQGVVEGQKIIDKLSGLSDAARRPYEAALAKDQAKLDSLRAQAMRSEQKTDANRNLSEKYRALVEERIRTVLGDSVEVAWEDFLHAGEFEKRSGNPKTPNVLDIIRLSTHALDPHSVAAHESLHAFISQLRNSGDHDINRVLFKAADSAAMRKQLETHFANEPEVLKQITGNDARASEERAAYMYQLHSEGKIVVGPKAEHVLGRIGEFIRKVLGIWSNDEHATSILKYFQEGKYAENMADRGKVTADLAAPKNAGIELMRNTTKPLAKIASTMIGVGETRLRDTGIPALKTIADLIHTGTSSAAEGGDTGFINAARVQYTRAVNEMSRELGAVSRAHTDEALEALQTGKQAKSPEALKAQQAIRKAIDGAYAHMKEAGVKIGDLGPDYFPRVWDTDALTRKAADFKAMIQKYIDAGKITKLDGEQVLAKLIGNQGAEIGIEATKPGMQHAKQRVFDFISAEDAAPYLSKDAYGTVNSYLQQSARRAEWTRRFGEGNSKLEKLYEQAKRDGATPEQLEMTAKYLNGVNGTLGDHISPWQRKLFANSIVYENVRLLGLGIFSSAPDAAGIFVRGGTVSDAFDTFKRGIKEVGRGLKKAENQKDDPHYQLAEDLGVIENAMLQHTVGSAYSQDLAGWPKKINEGFFKYNLMDQYNRSMRVGATIAASKFLARHAEGGYSVHSTRWLAELGLKPGDVEFKGPDVREKAERGPQWRVEDKREPLLTKQDFLDAGYDDATASAKSNVMAAAVNKWVDGAVLRPNAAQKPIWFNDPHYAIMSHLKQFTYAFQENILKRVVNEAKHGNYTPAMGLASYVPIMLAADLGKGLIQGGGSQPDWKAGWGASDYLWSALQRAGLFGVGQFAVDTVSHKSGAVGLLGPVLEQMAEGLSVAGGKSQFGSFAVKSMPFNQAAAGVADVMGSAKVDVGAGPNFAD